MFGRHLPFWMENPGKHFGASKEETVQFCAVKTFQGSSFLVLLFLIPKTCQKPVDRIFYSCTQNVTPALYPWGIWYPLLISVYHRFSWAVENSSLIFPLQICQHSKCSLYVWHFTQTHWNVRSVSSFCVTVPLCQPVGSPKWPCTFVRIPCQLLLNKWAVFFNAC